ncbi:MAG: hypothetical protein ACRDD8_11270 [Bacteroidales bacterium]
MKAKKLSDVITEKGKLTRSLKFKDVRDELTQSNGRTGVGFHEPTQTWWGWSHRAAYGFSIGSVVKKGDCAYKGKEMVAKTLADAEKMAEAFAESVS